MSGIDLCNEVLSKLGMQEVGGAEYQRAKYLGKTHHGEISVTVTFSLFGTDGTDGYPTSIVRQTAQPFSATEKPS